MPTIDDFEDQDVAEYGGATGSFSTQDSVVQNGTYALEWSAAAPSEGIHSTSGLDNYPAQDDTFHFHVRLDAGNIASANVGYAVQAETDDPERYHVTISRSNGVILRYESTFLAADNDASIPSDEWLDVKVEWTSGGGHTVTVFNSSDSQITQISATDTTLSSGGVGIRFEDTGAAGDLAWTDNWYIEDAAPAAPTNLQLSEQ